MVKTLLAIESDIHNVKMLVLLTVENGNILLTQLAAQLLVQTLRRVVIHSVHFMILQVLPQTNGTKSLSPQKMLVV